MKPSEVKEGMRVAVPEDRGDKAYVGKVTNVGNDLGTSIAGEHYIWVIVEHPKTGNKHVWPSNRLGKV